MKKWNSHFSTFLDLQSVRQKIYGKTKEEMEKVINVPNVWSQGGELRSVESIKNQPEGSAPRNAESSDPIRGT